jgi:transcriptional regulator of heat shock response
MKKSELKQTLKPLIKECIKECIFEEGVLSGIITEVLKGMQTQRVVTEGVTIQTKTDDRENEEKRRRLGEDMEKQRQERIKRLNESSQVGGINIFEGIEESAIPTDTPSPGPMSSQRPGDPGVNIDGIVNLVNGKWKHLI